MNFMKTIVAAGLVAASTSAFAADITGAGATFPFPIYSKWADAYKKETGNGLNYQSIGSGGGIKQIQAKTVTFGATDMPLKVDQLEKDGLVQWPMVMGAIGRIRRFAHQMETSNEFHESYRRCRPGRRIDVGVRRRPYRCQIGRASCRERVSSPV